MKINQNKLFTILKKIQEYQNKYIDFKKSNDPLNMAKTMWDIGDFLVKQGIQNPHSLGWEAEKQKAFIKRPLVFRSFVVRRIWKDKKKLEKELYGLKSLNSIIEFFPFLDQNEKWKVPKSKIKYLFHTLNTRSAKIFNKELKKVKDEYIGIKNDRRKHLKDYLDLKNKFYEFFNKLKKIIKEEQINDCLKFVDKINKENLKKFGNLCLYIATKKEITIEMMIQVNSQVESFNILYNLLIESTKSKDNLNRVRRVIDPLDLIKVTDICNSIHNADGIKAYRVREGLNINI